MLFQWSKRTKNYGIEKQRRQNITKFSIQSLTPHFANTMLYAVLFCACGLEICRSSGGKFILFWRRGKRGREKLFCSLWFCGWWSGLQMCFFLCGGLFYKFDFQLCKNMIYNRKNVIYKHENITFKRPNINYKDENMIYKRENIICKRANIVL